MFCYDETEYQPSEAERRDAVGGKTLTRKERALEAVRAGAVRHAHPFTWGIEAGFLDVKPATLQALAKAGRIKVAAGSKEFWRPVHEVGGGQRAGER